MTAVMIGVDPHKGSHTAVVIGPAEEPLGELRVRASAGQAEKLVAWAADWPERTWAVEWPFAGLGRLLARAARRRRRAGPGRSAEAGVAGAAAAGWRHNKSLGFGGVRFPRNVGSRAWLGRSRAGVRRWVCCPCAGAGAVTGFRVPEDAPECPGQLVCVARGSAAGHDRGVLPVTPFSLWCLVPGNKSGAGGDHAGWVLSLRARRSDSVFPAPLPGQLPAGSRSREARRR